ncbi:hypothetical protein P691DRAFT_810445 [Macrolepiota fuliginosa MF-IS2]|uniref:Uncharacterized protein n=1 Tax=Macrolepiota fuliginosa MF-IS2 TaxID=1400762 RepID=A0A9P5XIG4_9AGAR|nr:hypothetical protein P691DRAFT_810445 [Macrolepiota fuliginosa MF-IS2]
MVESGPPLPLELFDLIIREAWDQTCITTARLCLVSKAFLSEARKCLYEDITISFTVTACVSSPNYARVLKLHNTLTVLNPDLARLVRSLHYTLILSSCRESALFWGRLNTTFRNMDNLKRLTIRFGSIHHVPRMTTLFRGCKFQLEEFCLVRSWTRSTSNDDRSIIEFLSTQHEIRRLAIATPNLDEIPPTLCPRLEIVEGTGSIIRVLLRGRFTITKLVWKPSKQDPDYVLLDKYVAELASVRTLFLGGRYPRPVLRLLTPHLTQLEELVLFGRPPDNVNLMAELEEVPSLQKLRVFSWFSEGDMEDELVAREAQRALVERWFRAMPMLHSASFCVDDTLKSLLWKRGEVEPVVTDRVPQEVRGEA